MNLFKSPLKILNAISIFLFIYLIPMIINYLQSGPVLVGNAYQTELSYIVGLRDLINHFLKNFITYINFLKNPIFLFFVSAFFTQKTIKWVVSD